MHQDTPTPAAAAEFTVPQPTSSQYESNPFVVTAKGIVSILKTNPGTAMLMALVLGLIGFAGFFVVFLLMFIIHNLFVSLFLALAAFVGFFALAGLNIGTYTAVGSASLHDERITVRTALGRAADRLLALIGVTILQGILTALAFLLLIVPGFIVGARLSLAPIVLMEEKLGVMAALKRSWALTRGHTVEMLGALFAVQFIGGGGLLAPTVSIAPLFGRYKDLVDLERSGHGKPAVHWLNYLAVFGIVALMAITVGMGFMFRSAVNNYNKNHQNTAQPLQQQLQGNYNGSGYFNDPNSSSQSGTDSTGISSDPSTW
ncbi:MAG TPA: YciC family protein [Candidatus Saccharimonadales bacterium]|nr:YciC family protein [Candidatus Saccharimonadales bacterium]